MSLEEVVKIVIIVALQVNKSLMISKVCCNV